MRLSEFRSLSTAELDNILTKLCGMVEKQKQTEHPGMVAACIIDPSGRIVAKTSKNIGNKWSHAERNAIEEYKTKYGEVPAGSIVVTTLSPCNEHYDTTAHERHGSSCTDYLNNEGIKKVYCGFMDPTQDNSQAKFKQVVTKDKTIINTCKEFADTFLNLGDAQ